MINKYLSNINILILGLGLILLFIFIGKMIIDINKINNNIYQKRVLLETKYLHGLSLSEATKQIKESKIRLEQISDIVLSSDKTLKFINDLEKTAESLNLEQNIKLTEFTEPETITPIPIQISLQGSYLNILKYINQLDKKDYYLNTHQIFITSQSSNSSGNTDILAILSANIYWQ